MGNPYALLGVSPKANSSEIKSAYRQLARRYHPDVNRDPAAGEMFAQIHEAYQTLIDPERRLQYDQEVLQRGHEEAGGRGGATDRRAAQAARVVRQAHYQARMDRIVNEWMERERQETTARGKAVYTTVTLFLSTFFVAMTRPMLFETIPPLWQVALVLLFLVGAWHLVRSLKRHFDYYTYRPQKRTRGEAETPRAIKPFRRSVAWAFVIGGYLLSCLTGLLIGGMSGDYATSSFPDDTLGSAFWKVIFYPPMAVLIVDLIYLVHQRLEDL
jgi:hypothetical protein